ncbi:bifunctional diaminohydroxyphosphoribosylaminopyrimidine deaminase/5-amino-6-(5-phosphoribosylamino)uracil reductase RibD [Nitratireductor soli]|uniref:bifunctional diaminohydroxyphosphoribosylaminopyrimidine deaminase/5-amino-6-(5-phosphoribosylamino)uracil reductase RibD n=1 Tax=Nitratireductor soli TaxID=1670619 RepID=UPI00065DCB7D|nr:bifunctional diaminohydroxyphosphoribosylaminopyrimidine deaminase/5-amino-6-(5-phosphoribosylamino)uracil reductase RibD [Nitratireductor soli]
MVAAGGLANEADRRFMDAAIRLSRRHLGLTDTNPSVATLIVRHDDAGSRIVGRGVTAIGGRPHAEAEALAEAGEAARGATAYVTLEPCAHHGRTPPCANALVSAGIARVVGAAADPDPRVSGKGYAILRDAGVEVVEGVLADRAADLMRGYLTRSEKKRPEVTLKLAVSADGMIGRTGAAPGQGQIAITGETARRQVHLMRAESDAILVGIGTALADDPSLTCRLPGLDRRSPTRIVLDRDMRLPASSALVRSARDVPVLVTIAGDCPSQRRAELAGAGVSFLAVDVHEGHIALPELLDDLAARGIATLMVEGGAYTARAFLGEGLVDRLALFSGPVEIGAGGIATPIDPAHTLPGFSLLREARFGADLYREYVRNA